MALPNKTKESSENDYRVIDRQLFRALTSKKKDTETLCLVMKDAMARKQIFEGCHRGSAGDHAAVLHNLARYNKRRQRMGKAFGIAIL